jgi:hypothetical protein
MTADGSTTHDGSPAPRSRGGRIALIGLPRSGKTSFLYALKVSSPSHAKGQRRWQLGLRESKFGRLTLQKGEPQESTPTTRFDVANLGRMTRPWIPGLPLGTSVEIDMPEVAGEVIHDIARGDWTKPTAIRFLDFLGTCETLLLFVGIDGQDTGDLSTLGARLDAHLVAALEKLEYLIAEAVKRRPHRRPIAVSLLFTKADLLRKDPSLERVELLASRSSFAGMVRRYPAIGDLVKTDGDTVRFPLVTVLESSAIRGDLDAQEALAADFLKCHAPETAKRVSQMSRSTDVSLRFFLCAPYGRESRVDGRDVFPGAEDMNPINVFEPLENAVERSWAAAAGARMRRKAMLAAAAILAIILLGPGLLAYLTSSMRSAIGREDVTAAMFWRGCIEHHPLFLVESNVLPAVLPESYASAAKRTHVDLLARLQEVAARRSNSMDEESLLELEQSIHALEPNQEIVHRTDGNAKKPVSVVLGSRGRDEILAWLAKSPPAAIPSVILGTEDVDRIVRELGSAAKPSEAHLKAIQSDLAKPAANRALVFQGDSRTDRDSLAAWMKAVSAELVAKAKGPASPTPREADEKAIDEYDRKWKDLVASAPRGGTASAAGIEEWEKWSVRAKTAVADRPNEWWAWMPARVGLRKAIEQLAKRVDRLREFQDAKGNPARHFDETAFRSDDWPEWRSPLPADAEATFQLQALANRQKQFFRELVEQSALEAIESKDRVPPAEWLSKGLGANTGCQVALKTIRDAITAGRPEGFRKAIDALQAAECMDRIADERILGWIMESSERSQLLTVLAERKGDLGGDAPKTLARLLLGDENAVRFKWESMPPQTIRVLLRFAREGSSDEEAGTGTRTILGRIVDAAMKSQADAERTALVARANAVIEALSATDRTVLEIIKPAIAKIDVDFRAIRSPQASATLANSEAFGFVSGLRDGPWSAGVRDLQRWAKAIDALNLVPSIDGALWFGSVPLSVEVVRRINPQDPVGQLALGSKENPYSLRLMSGSAASDLLGRIGGSLGVPELRMPTQAERDSGGAAFTFDKPESGFEWVSTPGGGGLLIAASKDRAPMRGPPTDTGSGCTVRPILDMLPNSFTVLVRP